MTLFQTFFPDLYNTNIRSVDYNLLKNSDSEFILELNVAGIPESKIDVELSENQLKVSADVKDEREYIYQGISNGPFTRTFKLRDDVCVKQARIKDGILAITLGIEIPEEKKPKKIPLH